MGQVYIAISHPLADKRAVVKVLHHEHSRRPEIIARFHAEAFAASKIDDPNIVEVFDTGHLADGRPYMLLEYCSLGSLQNMLEHRGALPLGTTLTIAAQIASALVGAHEAGITHRDIKPGNILLKPAPGGLTRAKLGDFGIAKLHVDQLQDATRTATKKVLGSPGYMAPEQCSGKGAGSVDHRADIYAFASCLYEMVTGRRPYPGNNVFALMSAVTDNERFPPPSELRPELPPEWDRVILTGLAHDPAQRTDSLRDMILTLARTIPNGEAYVSYVAPRFVDNKSAPTAPTIADGIGPAVSQWAAAHSTTGHRQRRRSFGLAALVLAIGAALGIFVPMAVDHLRETRVASAATAPGMVGSDSAVATIASPRSATEATSIAASAPRATTSSPGAGVTAPTDAAIAIAHQDAATVIVRAEPPPAHNINATPREPAKAVAPDPKPNPVVARKELREAPHVDEARPAAQVEAGTGSLQVEVDPWAKVSIVGQSETYTTPITIQLSAGHHRVLLSKGTQQETVDVTITPNQTSHITRNW
jgi:serine/threonine-protein kinase